MYITAYDLEMSYRVSKRQLNLQATCSFAFICTCIGHIYAHLFQRYKLEWFQTTKVTFRVIQDHW